MTERHADRLSAMTELPVNQVALSGRVTSAPLERTLPSGDTILTFRVVVARERTPMTAKSRQSSDWVDCVAWGGRAKRSVSRWRVGDVVRLEGALRRRYLRGDTAVSTRVEVEVLGGRLLQRAADPDRRADLRRRAGRASPRPSAASA